MLCAQDLLYSSRMKLGGLECAIQTDPSYVGITLTDGYSILDKHPFSEAPYCISSLATIIVPLSSHSTLLIDSVQ